MTDLADSVPSLKNVLARPGTFGTLFPETTDDDLVLVLQDGLAEAHLEGLLLANTDDGNGLVTPDLTSGERALVLLFAGLRLIRSELMNRPLSRKYVAGPASTEETQATNVLRDIMRAMQAQKDQVVKAMSTTLGGGGEIFAMADAYVTRIIGENNAYVTTAW